MESSKNVIPAKKVGLIVMREYLLTSPNYCITVMVIGNTLRATPAMAAGIERDSWTVKELVEAAV